MSAFTRFVCKHVFGWPCCDKKNPATERDLIPTSIRNESHAVANKVTEIDAISRKITRDGRALSALANVARKIRSAHTAGAERT